MGTFTKDRGTPLSAPMALLAEIYLRNAIRLRATAMSNDAILDEDVAAAAEYAMIAIEAHIAGWGRDKAGTP